MSNRRVFSPTYYLQKHPDQLFLKFTHHASLISISDFTDFFKCRFYDEGYQDGFSHGRIHGLIEGRALGREKGFEMWEELGFYEGFAKTWMAVLVKQGKSDEYVLSSFLFLFSFPSTGWFYLFTSSISTIWLIYFIYSPSPLGVHPSTSDLSSSPSPNSRALTPPRWIPLLRRSTSPNFSARSDRVTRCSARPSACVRGCKVPKSWRWRTKRIEWTKMTCRRELPRVLLYQCGRSIRMA
jgi:hypothetical protein